METDYTPEHFGAPTWEDLSMRLMDENRNLTVALDDIRLTVARLYGEIDDAKDIAARMANERDAAIESRSALARECDGLRVELQKAQIRARR